MKKKKKWLCILLSLLILTSYAPTVYAAEESSDDTEQEQLLAPYFVIQSEDSSVDRFPLKETSVTTNINGMIAETYVTQTYTNEGDSPINAKYVFPTSSTVTVHGMRMEIGNNVVTAQIKEKEEAKEEYEEAKEEGKSASLLEQQRPNVFTMDVANIMPGDTARIELHYTDLITPTEGIYEFTFPTVVGPRYIAPTVSDNDAGAENNDWISAPYLPDGDTPPGEYNITVNLSTGVPIAELSCKSHEISVEQPDSSTAKVTLANPEDYAGNRDFILKYKLTGEGVESGLVLTSGETENFFMLTIQPPERYTPEEIPPREYIFVLDISGSMYGYPLDTAKTLIRDLVKNLNETDTFNLILFENDTTLLSSNSLPATADNIKKAMDLIDEQEGGGGTSLAPALETAVAIPKDDDFARSVVIITDGYIYNEQDIFDIINQNMNTTSFFSFGIGTAVNDYLINGIAKLSLGESFIVTDEEDALTSAARFRTYIESPLLTNINIAYDGFDVYDVAPSVPSTLFAQKPIVLFGKWKGDPSGTIRITGTSGDQEYLQEIPVSDMTIDMESEAIRYLWARTRLDQLAGYGSLRNDESVREEITKIGLQYSMATPYTSFVAVVDTIRNPEQESTDVEQALPLPLQVSNLAVGGGYMAYSEPGTILLVLIMAGIPLLHILRKAGKKKMSTCRSEK